MPLKMIQKIDERIISMHVSMEGKLPTNYD